MGKYFVGQGTGIVKDFDTLEDMIAFHKTMKPIDRHFCKLYDGVNHRIAEGWRVWHNGYGNESWRYEKETADEYID